MKPTNAGNARDASLIPGEENGSSSTPVFLPENIHGQKSLAGYSPWGRKEFGHNWAHTRMCTHTQWCQTKSTFMRFSYLSSKWVIKQWRQLGTATVHLTQELLTNIQCSGGSWSFVKETRALKNRVVASHRKVTATNWEQSLKLILLKLHEKLPKNSTLTILQSFSIWSKLKRWKNSISGSSWADRKFKKSSFWSVVFSYSTQQQQQTISQSDHDVWWKVDFIQHSAMTSSVVGQRRSKALPKAKFAPKKGHGHCLVVCCPSDPLQPSWILVKPLHLRSMFSKIDEMHWKLQCLQPAPVNRKGPILHDNTRPRVIQPTIHKLKELGYKVLPHLPYSPDLSPTNYHFFKHLDNFLQGKHFHSHQEADNAFQEFVESWSGDFYAIRINKLISHWQKCVNCNGSYFD